MIIEMTNGYQLALPLMISNMMAYGLARRLRPLPIYDALLAQDGIDLHPKRRDPLEGLAIDRVELDHPQVTFALETRDLFDVVATAGRQEVFPVIAGDRLVGIITLDDLTALAAEPELDGLVCAADLMRPAISLRPHDTVAHALELMGSIGVRELPVIDLDGHVLGLVDEAAIAREFMRARAADRPGAGSAPLGG
jgi:chloride channel protein, CIC family